MKSYSRNHLRPAFNHLAKEAKLAASLESDNPPSANELQLWSYQLPALSAGNYEVSVSQEVTLPSGETVNLDQTKKTLHVPLPKFRLPDPADLYSVHPAPGHSAHARTLANVVFSQPTTPWEREIPLEENLKKDLGSNKLPYMAVLTFSDEELILEPEAYKGFGFIEDYELSTEYGSVVTSASRLTKSDFPIKSVLNAPGASNDFNLDDHLSLLVLDSKIFKKVFTAYNGDNQPVWNGKADLSKFAFMASTQDSGSGFTASSFADDDGGEANKPHFSIVVSPRTGPPGISAPTRVVSHLISLEDVDKIAVSADDVTGQYVGLVSLHSWEWNAVPDGADDFGEIMIHLGKTIHSLVGPVSDQVKAGSSEALVWSKARADEGYVLKAHTDLTGAQTNVLIRGPLIPVAPSEDPPNAFSLYGEGLARFDKETEIPDVSYKSAWTLGRSMMMADRAVSASLLRLRGNIHSEAVRRAKAKALSQKGYGILSSRETYLDGLKDTVKHLQEAQNISGLNNGKIAADRWARPDNSNLPIMRLSNDTSYSIDDYEKEVNQVTLHMFGYESKDAEGRPVPVRQIDPDAATIRAWAVDRFLLAGVPMHSLILDPAMLPEESIRTFCVDNIWIDWLVDGGLSLANHFARDDDAIRRSFKGCINTYLNTPMDGGTIPQLPRWGFLMRSTAVSVFPDLKVEAPLPKEAPENARQVQFMQVLAEDVLVCLFDRLPGEQEFSYIRISQPHHQQGFCLGSSLSGSELKVFHRPLPKKAGPNVGHAVPDTFEKAPVLGFDFEARMLRPKAYMEKYQEAIKNIEDAYTGASESSSLLATQLRTYNLRLELKLKENQSHGVSNSDRWTKAAFNLSTGSRPEPGNETSEKESEPPKPVVRAPPSGNVGFPTGPRRQVRPPISPYDFEATRITQENSQILRELEPRDPLPYSATPLHVNCCLCYEPGDTSNVIYAPETPTDLIFNISAEESSGLPAEVELRIPVALSSGVYPPNVKNGGRGVLVIQGTGDQPILPALEDLSPGQWWSHDRKLATSSLYSFIPEALPDEGEPVPMEAGKLVMLIIKIKPRFEGLVASQSTSFKTSFILRGVTFLLPQPDSTPDWPVGPSRNPRFDVLWRPSSSGGKTSVRTTQLTVRPASIPTLEDDEIKFDLDKQTLHLDFLLSRVPPSGSKARLIVTRQGAGKPFKETLELPNPQSDPNGRGSLYSFDKVISKLGYFIPRETRVTIVAPDNGHMLGPDSVPFVFRQVPSREYLQGSYSYYWAKGHVSIIWPKPISTEHVPLQHKIAILSRLEESKAPLIREPKDDDKEIVRFSDGELEGYGNASLGLKVKVTITVENTSIFGTAAEWVATLTSMPEVKENGMAVTTSLKDPDPAVPVPASRFASMRFWSESGTAGFKTDMWYWRDGKRLAGIRWNASEETANEEAGPNIPQSKPNLTGAGALAVIQMHQDRRFKIVWIGNDGSVNLWSRENEGMGPENWSYSVLAPLGSASTLGGGCLAACGEVPVKEARPRRNPVIWWIGPRGEIFGRRAVPDDSNSEQWVDLEPGASLPAGSVDVSSSLSRPAQMATTWMYDSRKENEAAYLFWVRSNGDLMGTCSYTPSRETEPPLTGTAIAYRDVGAAPSTSVTAFIGNGTGSNGPMDARAYVLWVSTDGSLCLGSTGDVNWIFYGSSWDPIIRIASPGCANPLSDLCFLGHSSNTAAGVVWAGRDRKLQLAWAKSVPGAFGRNEWSPWGWKEFDLHMPIEQPPIIARAEASDALGRNFICFPAEGGKWNTCTIDLSSIKP